MKDLISKPTIPNYLFEMNRNIDSTVRYLSKKGGISGETDQDKLKETCLELESLFVYQLFKTMRTTIPKAGFIDGGRAEEIYTSLLDAEISKNVSGTTGLGLAGAMYEQLSEKTSKDDRNNETD